MYLTIEAHYTNATLRPVLAILCPAPPDPDHIFLAFALLFGVRILSASGTSGSCQRQSHKTLAIWFLLLSHFIYFVVVSRFPEFLALRKILRFEILQNTTPTPKSWTHKSADISSIVWTVCFGRFVVSLAWSHFRRSRCHFLPQKRYWASLAPQVARIKGQDCPQ